MAIITENFELSSTSRIYIFYEKDLLISKNPDCALPSVSDFCELKSNDLLKNIFFDSCKNALGAELKIKDENANQVLLNHNLCFIPQRQYFFENSAEESALSARIRSYLNWISETKYCSKCGARLKFFDKENALECAACKKIHYPRIEPCIIVLIHKNDEVLLLRHTYRNQDVYTCLAGFMEAGETAEQCVYREVKEEVGLEIKNLRYMGSQGWPYPDQLMLAFYADYKSGELKLQKDEISEARWIKNGEWLESQKSSQFPKPGSVAWRLIHGKF